MRTVIAISAGGLVFDDQGNVVVTARPSFKGETLWGFPKGIVESDETPEMAAVREVKEETGLDAEIKGPAEEIGYWYVQPGSPTQEPARVRKTVHFFPMRITGGDPALHDPETLEVRIIPVAEAMALISFDSEKDLLAKVGRR